VQVDPIKPTLKPPGTKRLKLKRDILLSKSAFKFSLRRYNKGGGGALSTCDHCDFPNTKCNGAKTSMVSDSRWINTTSRLQWGFPNKVERRMLNSIEARVESACIQALKLKSDDLLS